jgi:hypothetical protein
MELENKVKNLATKLGLTVEQTSMLFEGMNKGIRMLCKKFANNSVDSAFMDKKYDGVKAIMTKWYYYTDDEVTDIFAHDVLEECYKLY